MANADMVDQLVVVAHERLGLAIEKVGQAMHECMQARRFVRVARRLLVEAGDGEDKRRSRAQVLTRILAGAEKQAEDVLGELVEARRRLREGLFESKE